MRRSLRASQDWLGGLAVLVTLHVGAAKLTCRRRKRPRGLLASFVSRVADGVALAVVLTVTLTACTGVTSNGSEAFRASEMSALRALKLVNYFPASSSWQYMWEDFQPGVINRDMARIAGLHANGVRIIISTVAFGFPSPHPQDLSELRDVIQMAERHGLRVQLTLFDGFSGWQAILESREWARAVLTAFAGDREIAFIELRNEIAPSDPAQMTWCRNLLPYTEKLAAGVPVTVSVSNGGALKLADLRQQLRTVRPDFWDLHYYGTAGDAYNTFAAALAAVRPDLLYIGEFGFSTWPGNASTVPGLSSSQGAMDAYQAFYYASVEAASKALGLPPAAPWTLNDFTRANAPPQPSPAEYFYGMYRLNGSSKPAAAVINQFFGTGKVPELLNQNYVANLSQITERFRPSHLGEEPGREEINRD